MIGNKHSPQKTTINLTSKQLVILPRLNSNIRLFDLIKKIFKTRIRSLSSLFLIISGQAISAVAAIISLRLLSKYMTPSEFGSATLSIGIIALLQGIIALPILQSGLWYYPSAIADNRTSELKIMVLRILRNDLSLWLVGLAIVSCLIVIPFGVKQQLVFAGITLLISEVIKSYEITFLNAEGNQRSMSFLVISDALLKPTFAVLFLARTMLERSEAMLIGYSIGSWVALLFCWKINKSATLGLIFKIRRKDQQDGLKKALRDYAFPLRMNPLLGWLTGQGDRYIIGTFGGLHSVGIYSSLYSIVSRPFLMVSAIVELWFRQQFYTKISVGDFDGAKKIFIQWLSGVVAFALALVVVFTALKSWVSSLILDSRFQGHSHVMVWIGVGYVFHVAYLVVERVFYAFGNTGMVLKMQILGACLSMLIPLLMVLAFGWVGAAWAVPFYFGLQLVVSIMVAKVKYGVFLRSIDK